MNGRLRQHGFTLIEILVAVALIGIILSISYGSYVTTTKSAESCKSRIAISEKGRRALEHISRHIRCSYAGAVSKNEGNARSATGKEETQLERSVNYFKGDAGSRNGEILQLVTTCGLSENKETGKGLYEVAYKFNRRTRQIASIAARFVGTPQKARSKNWQVISDEVESVDLEFFDGEDWLRKWDFTKKKKLPRAVRIEIAGLNEDLKRYEYSTIAYISCSEGPEVTRTETSVSAGKR